MSGVPASGRPPGDGIAGETSQGAIICLGLIALAFALIQLVVVSPTLPLGWDETVYVSQVSPHVPAAYFSAPRARGITLLVAPVVAVTSSTGVLRGYLTALSAIGLVVAFWPWLRIVPRRVVALAAALFASLWVVQFYGNAVMPNLYVAYGSVAAVGTFLRAMAPRNGGRGVLALLAASVAFVTLVRPPDAAYLCLALVAFLLAARGRAAFAGRKWRWPGRDLLPGVAILGGFAVGLLPWLVEAVVRFGGPLARLHSSSEAQGDMDWQFGIGMQLRALNGPLLCRPCTATWSHPALSLWWLAIPPLVAAGLLAAKYAGRLRPAAVATLCGATLSVPYLFTLGYAAPRFLIPTYALLVVPVAECAFGAASMVPHRWRRATVYLLVVAFAGHIVSQQLVLNQRQADQGRARMGQEWLADRLGDLGLRAPCTITGQESPPIAFRTGCASAMIGGNNASTTLPELLRLARARPLAVTARSPKPPSYARNWELCPFTLPDGKRWYVYLAPFPGVTCRKVG